MSAASELRDARQALWDVYRALGFDCDGDATPDAIVGLNALVVRAAQEFREDYDQAIERAAS